MRVNKHYKLDFDHSIKLEDKETAKVVRSPTKKS